MLKNVQVNKLSPPLIIGPTALPEPFRYLFFPDAMDLHRGKSHCHIL